MHVSHACMSIYVPYSYGTNASRVGPPPPRRGEWLGIRSRGAVYNYYYYYYYYVRGLARQSRLGSNTGTGNSDGDGLPASVVSVV